MVLSLQRGMWRSAADELNDLGIYASLDLVENIQCLY